MAATTQSALDIIVGALRNINALEAGETPSAQDANDALQVLNDMLESWSIDKCLVFAQTENFLNFTAGQYQYTIGNAPGGTFTGVATSGSPTITGVTVPSGLAVGAPITDAQGLFPTSSYSFPAGTSVLSYNSGLNTVTMTQNATANSIGSDTFTYLIPGNFYQDAQSLAPIQRPVRITNAFTRITSSGNTGLDYPIDIITKDKYTVIGLKGVSGPWPTMLYYDPTYPWGTIYFYPNPSQAGVLHLWSDTVLADFQTINQTILLPQGYARALKKNLALELAPEYGKTAGALLVRQAKESKDSVRALNSIPTVTAFFDADIVRGKRTDAGWIMHGGFAN